MDTMVGRGCSSSSSARRRDTGLPRRRAETGREDQLRRELPPPTLGCCHGASELPAGLGTSHTLFVSPRDLAMICEYDGEVENLAEQVVHEHGTTTMVIRERCEISSHELGANVRPLGEANTAPAASGQRLRRGRVRGHRRGRGGVARLDIARRDARAECRAMRTRVRSPFPATRGRTRCTISPAATLRLERWCANG